MPEELGIEYLQKVTKAEVRIILRAPFRINYCDNNRTIVPLVVCNEKIAPYVTSMDTGWF